jgi:hypothetical protein
VVKRNKPFREIQLEYSFDRLSVEKVVQAYRLLVPEKIWATADSRQSIERQKGGTGDESRGDLCAGVLGSAKG